ncbi:hypothetical protein Fcan01_13076 [Folsomia candida]|uniref:Uncharacterized protein n=1 Tax=Folsomia candida TaxID=158441 RepID=A0A226E6Q6_FOLCA|nr:hypothetical protein Fcan01_13076 [Folsomia candida]
MGNKPSKVDDTVTLKTESNDEETEPQGMGGEAETMNQDAIEVVALLKNKPSQLESVPWSHQEDNFFESAVDHEELNWMDDVVNVEEEDRSTPPPSTSEAVPELDNHYDFTSESEESDEMDDEIEEERRKIMNFLNQNNEIQDCQKLDMRILKSVYPTVSTTLLESFSSLDIAFQTLIPPTQSYDLTKLISPLVDFEGDKDKTIFTFQGGATIHIHQKKEPPVSSTNYKENYGVVISTSDEVAHSSPVFSSDAIMNQPPYDEDSDDVPAISKEKGNKRPRETPAFDTSDLLRRFKRAKTGNSYMHI